MKINSLLSRIPNHYWGYLGLALWIIISLSVLRHDLYGLNEGAAKSTLLTWSIADQIASSVVTFGTPDLRALLFLPTGFLWTGNVFATKVLTVLLLAVAARLLYSWKEQASDTEGGLLATGLLLISPMVLWQLDTLSVGTYLLIAFVFGAWVDKAYRTTPKSFGGWYFAQLLICAFSVSLHPAGLAYPVALLWSWRTEPLDPKQQKYFLIGISFTVLLILIIRMGWAGQSWFHNPLQSLGEILIPNTPLPDDKAVSTLLAGGIVLAVLTVTVIKQFTTLRTYLIGRTLLAALAFGAFVGDQAWALIALTVILYFGLPLLLRSKYPTSNAGFMKQRGWVLLFVFILSTWFMQADKIHYTINSKGLLSAQDQLIKTLADEAAKNRQANELAESKGEKIERFRVASQWPSRTMIACKCDTLPLPPAAKDPVAQLKMLRGISYLLLDPKETKNLALTRNLSLLGSTVETVSLQRGGVLLHVTSSDSTAQTRPAKQS
jgi:hypothetical protein